MTAFALHGMLLTLLSAIQRQMRQAMLDDTQTPILYSFRRCPYAMRARMAIASAGLTVQLREVVLKNKPPEMISTSPKATVPIIDDAEAGVLEESLDIMLWALAKSDPEHWLPSDDAARSVTESLITACDENFKPWLDKYKYADRHPEHTAEYYREQGELFIQQLIQRLKNHRYLIDDQPRLADIAIFPFVRQFAHVDRNWFDSSEYAAVQRWYRQLHESDTFLSVMQKYPAWQNGDAVTLFPVPSVA